MTPSKDLTSVAERESLRDAKVNAERRARDAAVAKHEAEIAKARQNAERACTRAREECDAETQRAATLVARRSHEEMIEIARRLAEQPMHADARALAVAWQQRSADVTFALGAGRANESYWERTVWALAGDVLLEKDPGALSALLQVARGKCGQFSNDRVMILCSEFAKACALGEPSRVIAAFGAVMQAAAEAAATVSRYERLDDKAHWDAFRFSGGSVEFERLDRAFEETEQARSAAGVFAKHGRIRRYRAGEDVPDISADEQESALRSENEGLFGKIVRSAAARLAPEEPEQIRPFGR